MRPLCCSNSLQLPPILRCSNSLPYTACGDLVITPGAYLRPIQAGAFGHLTGLLPAFLSGSFHEAKSSKVVAAWPRRQASLGSPEPPLPWEGHARPSSNEDHPEQDNECLRTEFCKDQEPTVQVKNPSAFLSKATRRLLACCSLSHQNEGPPHRLWHP